MTTITVFKGDGIGPEITDAVIKVLNAANAKLEYEVFNVGAKVYEETGEYIPEKAFESYGGTCRRLWEKFFKSANRLLRIYA